MQPSVDSVTTFGPAWIGRPIVELTDLTYFGRPARLVWQTPVVGPVTAVPDQVVDRRSPERASPWRIGPAAPTSPAAAT